MKILFRVILTLVALLFIGACTTGKDVVRVVEVESALDAGLTEKEIARLAQIKAAEKSENNGHELKNVIRGTRNYSVMEYFATHPDVAGPVANDYRVGGYDVLDITVYEEEDLSRKEVRISADGYITFPLVGRIEVAGLTTSEIENLIAVKLAQGQLIIDAHVSVSVSDYKSKQFLVLGPVNSPGSYPLKARERVVDAISMAGGIDSSKSGSELMIIRTENPDTRQERKIVIRIDIQALLYQGNQNLNLRLLDRDLLYIPKAEKFYIIGQVQSPGSFFYTDKDITLVGAISMAGGFTKIAARNRTRIIRVEDGKEKIITVKVDAITKSGKKAQDIRIEPEDIIVVPESYF